MDEEVAECPYCHTVEDNCDHLMLVADITFMEVVGGQLYALANRRLSEMMNDVDPDEHGNIFQEFLEEVSSCGGYEVYYEFEGGPGQSSSNVNYYSEDPEQMANAYSKLIG